MKGLVCVLFTAIFFVVSLGQPAQALRSTDIDNSGSVDMLDLFVLSGQWEEVATPGSGMAGDFDGNGTCGPEDLLALLRYWHTIGYTDLPPYIISVAPEEAQIGMEYRYHTEAVDPEGSEITFDLTDSPSGMVISPTGFITWTPTQTGLFPVEIMISDGIHSVTETWGIQTVSVTLETTVEVDHTQGARIEITEPTSALYGAHIVIPAGALEEDATITLTSSTGEEQFFDTGTEVHLAGLELASGEVEFQVPVSNSVLESVTSELQLGLFVHDALSGEWILVEDVQFIPASAKDKLHNKGLAGWIKGKIKKAGQDIRIVIDKVKAFGKAVVSVAGRVAKSVIHYADTLWFQDEKFYVYKGSEDDFWNGSPGRKNLLVVHGVLSDARELIQPGGVADSLSGCYDNILIWQYRTAKPIGKKPFLLERIAWSRSGELLWKQFSNHYVQKSLNKSAPKGFKSRSGVNSGVPLLSLKDTGWDFKCDIIAHSMGGLVVRDMLEKQPYLTTRGSHEVIPQKQSKPWTRVADLVNNLVTLGTPHNGALWTGTVSSGGLYEVFGTVLNAVIKEQLPSKVLIALETLGPGIVDLLNDYYVISQDFVDYLNSNRPTGLHTQYWQVAGNCCFNGTYDKWVPINSALLNATMANKKVCEGFDHVQLLEEFGSEGGAKDWVVAKLGLSCTTPTTPQMVTLPPGSFQMGNTGAGRDAQFGYSDEFPRHTVNINYSFQMGKYEVTNAQYADILNWARGRGYLRNSSNQPYNGGDVYHNGQLLFAVVDGSKWWEKAFIKYNGSNFYVEPRNGEPQGNHPVGRVTWYGSVAFCNWLSEKEGRSLAYNLSTWSLTNRQGGGYRLPSESEWEYACRGSSSNPNRYAPFSFGDDLGVTDLWSCQSSSLFNQYMVWCGNDDGWSEAVGSRLPNDYGLYDMHGNVWEWCQDWWHDSYNGAPEDGSAWGTVGSYGDRVVRGGSWYDSSSYCRSAARSGFDPDNRFGSLGLRLVLVP